MKGDHVEPVFKSDDPSEAKEFCHYASTKSANKNRLYHVNIVNTLSSQSIEYSS